MKLSPQEWETLDAWIDRELYQKSIAAGDHFFAAYAGEEKGMSQVRNLKNQSLQATQFLQLENFVKNQIGKEKAGQGWLFVHNGKILGKVILDDFAFINAQAETLAKGKYEKKCEFRKQMVKAYVEALTVHFRYRKKISAFPKEAKE